MHIQYMYRNNDRRSSNKRKLECLSFLIPFAADTNADFFNSLLIKSHTIRVKRSEY